MDKEIRREWKIDECPIWRWVVVEDYTEDSSFIILIFNHCVIDGINVAAYLKLASDDFDPETIRYPKTPNASLVVKIIVGIFYGIWNGLFLLSRTPA